MVLVCFSCNGLFTFLITHNLIIFTLMHLAFVPVQNSCHPVSVAGVKSTEKFTAPYPAVLPYIVSILYTNPTIAVLCAKAVRVLTHATIHVHPIMFLQTPSHHMHQ